MVKRPRDPYPLSGVGGHGAHAHPRRRRRPEVPAQAVQRSQEALRLAHALNDPFSLAAAQHYAAFLHHHRHETLAVQTLAGDLLTRL
jgi:hypothetical protein